jgi:hypothetical protein
MKNKKYENKYLFYYMVNRLVWISSVLIWFIFIIELSSSNYNRWGIGVLAVGILGLMKYLFWKIERYYKSKYYGEN